jgi:UDP-galactopyranose mutase
MKKKLLLILTIAVSGLVAKAQDSIKVTSDAPLVITGSVDAYYKYDFAGKKFANIPTSFANESNSISIGMIVWSTWPGTIIA